MAGVLRAAVGTDEPLPDGFWSALLQTQGRGVLLTVFAALLGFGLANLVRNTGAALGIAFVYVVVVENAVRALRPHWDPFLLSTNALGLVQDGGLTIQVFDDQEVSADGFLTPVEYFVGPLQATVLLAVVTAVRRRAPAPSSSRGATCTDAPRAGPGGGHPGSRKPAASELSVAAPSVLDVADRASPRSSRHVRPAAGPRP